MKLLGRVLPALCAAALLALASGAASASSRLIKHRAGTPLPFTVNLAPGDVFVHGSDRDENTSNEYEQRTMDAGDQVVGMGGQLRSVILPGDASAIEVLQGSRLVARSGDKDNYLDLAAGETRVGRASFGDGEPIRFMIKTHNVGAIVHGGDLVVSRGAGHTSSVRPAERDHRYLFSQRVSFRSLNRLHPGHSTQLLARRGITYNDEHLAFWMTPPGSSAQHVQWHAHRFYRHHHHHRHHHFGHVAAVHGGVHHASNGDSGHSATSGHMSLSVSSGHAHGGSVPTDSR